MLLSEHLVRHNLLIVRHARRAALQACKRGNQENMLARVHFGRGFDMADRPATAVLWLLVKVYFKR